MKARCSVMPVLSLLVIAVSGCAARSGNVEPSKPPEVTAADLEANPTIPIENVLQRKVPGLIVRRTSSGGISIQIRGSSDYRDRPTLPLYVLNDLPFQPGPGGELEGVNPYDIESIRFLRGAEAALYGIEGANGVIVITTKRGATTRQ